MKAMIETVTGMTMTREINISDTPIHTIRAFYQEDATAASQIFSSERAIGQLMDGHIDEDRSAFELITIEGDSIRADWKIPLCNQPARSNSSANSRWCGTLCCRSSSPS